MKILLFVIGLSMSNAWAFETLNVSVKGMVCSFCAQGIEKKFSAHPAVESVKANLTDHNVTLVLRDGQQLDDATVEKLLKDAGYSIDKVVRK